MTAIVVACDGVRLLFAWMSSLLTNKKPKSEIPDVPLTVAYLRSLQPFLSRIRAQSGHDSHRPHLRRDSPTLWY
jgi:hypothetical protein